MKKYFAHLLIAAVAVCAAAPLFAVPAAPGVKAPSSVTCRPNMREVERRVKAWRAMKAAGAPFATVGVPPTTMTPKILVLRVDFSGTPMTTSFANTTNFFNQVSAFFLENSYGVFVASFTVSSSVYHLSGTLASYGADCAGDVACHDQQMFNEAVSSATATFPGTNLAVSPYDHIMIYHAGNGQETSGSASDIWSLYFPDAQTINGKTFQGFTVVPESEAGGYSPLGVICHEYGHQLGLPDLYDTAVPGGQSTVGVYDLMDYPYTGEFGADGSNPPHLGAWSKKFLGFITLQSQSGLISFGPAETVSNAFQRIPIAGVSSNEYFLIEYRSRTAAAFDKGISMSGLAIWHIDDDVALNSSILSQNIVNAASLNGRGHRGIELVEADGTEANPSASDLGNGNLFVDGQNFAFPQSNSFNGTASGVAISGISGVGTGAVSANMTFIQAAAVLSIAKVVNYPNPAGDTSKYPVRTGAPAGTVTTLMLQLSQPVAADKISLDIYTVNGERVHSAGSSGISLRLGAGEPTTDNKWVYEYDWNGKTDSGAMAAPGVYFYRFKVNGKFETGKLVLVR